MGLLDRLLRRPTAPMSELERQVREVLDSVQAYARSHGGELHLVNVSDEGEVKLQLRGACRTCPVSDLTVKVGVERQLLNQIPEIKRVVVVD